MTSPRSKRAIRRVVSPLEEEATIHLSSLLELEKKGASLLQKLAGLKPLKAITGENDIAKLIKHLGDLQHLRTKATWLKLSALRLSNTVETLWLTGRSQILTTDAATKLRNEGERSALVYCCLPSVADQKDRVSVLLTSLEQLLWTIKDNQEGIKIQVMLWREISNGE